MVTMSLPIVQSFTDKEIQCIKFLVMDKSTKEIASLMNLSRRTIESYRTTLRNKTGAKSSVGIIVYAIKNKIVDLNNIV